MISYLQGILASIEIGAITVDIGGVGYEVKIPPSVSSKLPKVGEKIKIYTYLKVSEDAQTLYGFLTKEERNLFTTLISVSGLGPRGALSLLSSTPLDRLVAAIAKGNVDLLTMAQGIGAKTAQRIVIELKEKVGQAYALEPTEFAAGLPQEKPSIKDAISALVALGYAPHEAKQAIVGQAGVESANAEDLIRGALKSLS